MRAANNRIHRIAYISLGCPSKISCAVLVFVISLHIPSKHVNSGHYRPASKTPSERRFAGGPIVARDWILAWHIICRCRPLNSFAVHRAANSINPDQTEPTLFAKNISKMFQQKTKQTRFIVISVFSALEIFFYFQNVMLFSKSAQNLMKSRIMLAAIHRGLHCLPKCLLYEKQDCFSLL